MFKVDRFSSRTPRARARPRRSARRSGPSGPPNAHARQQVSSARKRVGREVFGSCRKRRPSAAHRDWCRVRTLTLGAKIRVVSPSAFPLAWVHVGTPFSVEPTRCREYKPSVSDAECRGYARKAHQSGLPWLDRNRCVLHHHRFLSRNSFGKFGSVCPHPTRQVSFWITKTT